MIFALHGFLGRPQDWLPLSQNNFDPSGFCAYDLFYDLKSMPSAHTVSLSQWAHNFNQLAAKEPSPRILLGYSLGGRLALHALLQQPDIWDAAVIISAHTGLESQQGRNERLISDCEWAARFEVEPWEPLIQSWNARSIFDHSVSVGRCEKDYSRFALACALREWSLGKQEYLIPQINKVDVPILWMVGDLDQNYVERSKKVILKHPSSKMVEISGAGHRIPWQQPQAFAAEVTQFLTNIR